MLGEVIKGRRQDMGLSRREFANRIGVDATTIRQWESEEIKPDEISLSNIASVFGDSVEGLVNEQGSVPPIIPAVTLSGNPAAGAIIPGILNP